MLHTAPPLNIDIDDPFDCAPRDVDDTLVSVRGKAGIAVFGE
jgi:hypothetical protein